MNTTTTKFEKPRKDVGETNFGNTIRTGDLSSDVQRILRGHFEKIGNSTTAINSLEVIPSWITNESLRAEHKNNWIGALKKGEWSKSTKQREWHYLPIHLQGEGEWGWIPHNESTNISAGEHRRFEKWHKEILWNFSIWRNPITTVHFHIFRSNRL